MIDGITAIANNDKFVLVNVFSELECAFYNGECMTTDFDVGGLLLVFEQYGTNYSLSDKFTSYLCNAAYCHMLKRIPAPVYAPLGHDTVLCGRNNAIGL